MLSDEDCKNIPFHNINVDPLAKCVVISDNVTLPISVSKSLGWELSACQNLSCLEIPNKPLVAAAIVDSLGPNRNLEYLDVNLCKISGCNGEQLCKQFHQLQNLKVCDLSGNALGNAGNDLAESILSWGVNHTLTRPILAELQYSISCLF